MIRSESPSSAADKTRTPNGGGEGAQVMSGDRVCSFLQSSILQASKHGGAAPQNVPFPVPVRSCNELSVVQRDEGRAVEVCESWVDVCSGSVSIHNREWVRGRAALHKVRQVRRRDVAEQLQRLRGHTRNKQPPPQTKRSLFCFRLLRSRRKERRRRWLQIGYKRTDARACPSHTRIC